jgi:hypothetical protein
MKSSIARKNPKKWYFFRKDVLLYDNKRLILKKGPRHRLALETSFQTKKKYWFHIVLEESCAGDTPWKTCFEKNAKQVFEVEFIKIFREKRGFEKKTLSFLKDPKTGYLPMHLSQFRKIWRKSIFLRGGEALK